MQNAIHPRSPHQAALARKDHARQKPEQPRDLRGGNRDAGQQNDGADLPVTAIGEQLNRAEDRVLENAGEVVIDDDGCGVCRETQRNRGCHRASAEGQAGQEPARCPYGSRFSTISISLSLRARS